MGPINHRGILNRRLSFPSRQSALGCKSPRRGTTTVEFAMVCPFVFLFFFASIEFGRLQMAYHGLEGAAREGCRIAMSWKATPADVAQTVTNRLRSFGISGQSLTILPSPLSGAREWEPITVRVEVPYSQVSWLPTPRFIQGYTLVGSCTLPKEAVDPGS